MRKTTKENPILEYDEKTRKWKKTKYKAKITVQKT